MASFSDGLKHNADARLTVASLGRNILLELARCLEGTAPRSVLVMDVRPIAIVGTDRISTERTDLLWNGAKLAFSHTTSAGARFGHAIPDAGPVLTLAALDVLPEFLHTGPCKSSPNLQKLFDTLEAEIRKAGISSLNPAVTELKKSLGAV